MVLLFELKAQSDEFHQINLVRIEISAERHGNDVFWIIAQQLAGCKSTNSHSNKLLPLRDVFDIAEIVTYFKCLRHNYLCAEFEWIFKRLIRSRNVILAFCLPQIERKLIECCLVSVSFCLCVALATCGWNNGAHWDCMCTWITLRSSNEIANETWQNVIFWFIHFWQLYVLSKIDCFLCLSNSEWKDNPTMNFCSPIVVFVVAVVAVAIIIEDPFA